MPGSTSSLLGRKISFVTCTFLPDRHYCPRSSFVRHKRSICHLQYAICNLQIMDAATNPADLTFSLILRTINRSLVHLLSTTSLLAQQFKLCIRLWARFTIVYQRNNRIQEHLDVRADESIGITVIFPRFRLLGCRRITKIHFWSILSEAVTARVLYRVISLSLFYNSRRKSFSIRKPEDMFIDSATNFSCCRAGGFDAVNKSRDIISTAE